MGEDGKQALYQPVVHLQIEWRPGESEPDVTVWADADSWKLPLVVRVLRQVIEWHQAEESFSAAFRDGLPTLELEEQNAEDQRDALYELAHSLIYDEADQGFGSS